MKKSFWAALLSDFLTRWKFSGHNNIYNRDIKQPNWKAFEIEIDQTNLNPFERELEFNSTRKKKFRN